MTNEEKPILLPLHPKELSDEEFSVYEAEFEKVLSDPFRGAPPPRLIIWDKTK